MSEKGEKPSNDHNQAFWAREIEHPQQTIVLTKTAGQQPEKGEPLVYYHNASDLRPECTAQRPEFITCRVNRKYIKVPITSTHFSNIFILRNHPKYMVLF